MFPNVLWQLVGNACGSHLYTHSFWQHSLSAESELAWHGGAAVALQASPLAFIRRITLKVF